MHPFEILSTVKKSAMRKTFAKYFELALKLNKLGQIPRLNTTSQHGQTAGRDFSNPENHTCNVAYYFLANSYSFLLFNFVQFR